MRKIKLSIAAVVVVCSNARLSAAMQEQDPHTVQPERPTVATHAGTVAPGWWEIEFGGELDRYDDRSQGASIPIVVKFGLASQVQLSIFESVVAVPGSGVLGAGDVAVGVKWRLADDAPLLGRFAILPSIKFPSGSAASGLGTGTTDASLLLISSHDLGPVALDINAGYTRRSGGGVVVPVEATFWTVSFGGPAGGMAGWVAELYGYPRTSGPSGQDAIVAFLFGPTLNLYPWLALDAGIIVPVTGPQPRAVYLGGVWNLGRVTR